MPESGRWASNPEPKAAAAARCMFPELRSYEEVLMPRALVLFEGSRLDMSMEGKSPYPSNPERVEPFG
jgi:hypothetical protein